MRCGRRTVRAPAFGQHALVTTANVGQASRLPGRAKRGLGGANAAPFGAAGQAGRLPYVPGTAWRRLEVFARPAGLLLPGALLVTMGAELLAPFVFVDFRFAPFFQ